MDFLDEGEKNAESIKAARQIYASDEKWDGKDIVEIIARCWSMCFRVCAFSITKTVHSWKAQKPIEIYGWDIIFGVECLPLAPNTVIYQFSFKPFRIWTVVLIFLSKKKKKNWKEKIRKENLLKLLIQHSFKHMYTKSTKF